MEEIPQVFFYGNTASSKETPHNFDFPGNTTLEKAVEDMEEFSCKTRLISGAGTISALAELGGKRLFLVTDPFFVKNGVAKQAPPITATRATMQANIFQNFFASRFFLVFSLC